MGSKSRYCEQRAKKEREFRGIQFSKAKDAANLRKAVYESETPTTRRPRGHFLCPKKTKNLVPLQRNFDQLKVKMIVRCIQKMMEI